MKLSSLSRHLLGASLLTLCASGAIAAEKVTLKLAHNLDRSHVVHQAFEEMAKEVQQLSNGNMRVRIYPSSQMGSARETLELLQNGALDMTKGSASDLESFDNTYAIYNLPYLFKDQAHFNRVVFGEVGLAGEIRPVPSGQERITEAAKHGFRRAIVPHANVPKKVPAGMQVFGVKKLADALAILDDL